jgi:uncharacterized protein (TIRG00374 family)
VRFRLWMRRTIISADLCVPWDMLMRATFMPAEARFLIMRELSLAGPIVQMIFVWRKSRRSCETMGGSLASREPRANFARVSEDKKTMTSSPSFLRRVGPVLLLVALMFAVFSAASDVRALGRSLTAFHWPSLGVALILVSGNYFLRFLRWQFYLRTLEVSVPRRLSFLVFLSGFVMSVTPGKMGEVWKSVLLHEYRGIGIARTASIVVAERLLDLVALVVLVSLGSAAFASGRAIALSGAVLVLGIVLACTVRPFGYFGLGLLARIKALRGISGKLRETYDALHALTRPKPFFASFAYALTGWTLECAATWVLVSGFPGSVIGWDGATFGYAAGTLAGALAMLPGGLGVAEFGMSSSFRAAASVMTVATATAATILVRLCTLWFGVAVGGIALGVLRSTTPKLDTTREPNRPGEGSSP